MRKKKEIYIFARRAVQALSLLLMLYLVWQAGRSDAGALNPAVYFRLDPLVMLVTSVAERVFLWGLALSAVTLLLTFVFGRFFCGWICPLGALFDFITRLKGVFVKKKAVASGAGADDPAGCLGGIRRAGRRAGRRVKYWLLAAIGVLAVAGIQLAWFFDPISIFVRTFTFNIYPFLNTLINGFFSFLLKITGYASPVETVYEAMKEHVLETTPHHFPHTAFIFLFFLALAGLTLYRKRFWCRYVCPLGALFSLPAKYSPFGRQVHSCRSHCGLCRDICRMSAIKEDNSYVKQECILCLDCMAYCPNQDSTFGFEKTSRMRPAGAAPGAPGEPGARGEGGMITRSQFIKQLAVTALLVAGYRVLRGENGVSPGRPVVRPPAALPEGEFVNRCIRCGNCMKACVTNGLQPCILESGLGGVWTPRIDSNMGYCEYGCTRCGNVCPTGAIKPLTEAEKAVTRLGTAKVDRTACIPWVTDDTCLVCEEHCPVSNKAIKLSQRKTEDGEIIKLPEVDPNLCVGCGICEYVCPAVPRKAIRVTPL